MSQLQSISKIVLLCAAALALSLSSRVACAQTVKGVGVTFITTGLGDYEVLFEQIAVNAWLDSDGIAHGTIAWEGDTPFVPGPDNYAGGPANPYLLDVTDILFDGNTAWVGGVVTNSVDGQGNGLYYVIPFTDNSGTGEPDEVFGAPIDAGHITIED